MTNPLDLASTPTGQKIPEDQARTVAKLKGLDFDNNLFTRGRFRAPGSTEDVDYVLVQSTITKRWSSFKVSDLNSLITA